MTGILCVDLIIVLWCSLPHFKGEGDVVHACIMLVFSALVMHECKYTCEVHDCLEFGGLSCNRWLVKHCSFVHGVVSLTKSVSAVWTQQHGHDSYIVLIGVHNKYG